MLVILALILFITIMTMCGNKGAKSIVTTAINAILLLFAIYLIYLEIPPLLVTLGISAVFTCIILFYQNEMNIKSKISFISVMIVILVLVPFVYWLTSGAGCEGFGNEQYEITDSNGYKRNIAMDMFAIQISIMIIALIGTVADTAVAITSSIYEIYDTSPGIEKKALMKSGFIVGKSILSTSMHTIFYIYIAEYITLMIQYVQDYSLAEMINSKAFSQEFICISVSGIGCCLIVPVATFLSVALMHRMRRPSEEEADTIESKL